MLSSRKLERRIIVEPDETDIAREILAAFEALEIAFIHNDDVRFAAEASHLRQHLNLLLRDDGGWKPIRTAPKDGTRVDLWLTVDGKSARSTDAAWNSDIGDWHLGSIGMNSGSVSVTHWRAILGPHGDDDGRCHKRTRD